MSGVEVCEFAGGDGSNKKMMAAGRFREDTPGQAEVNEVFYATVRESIEVCWISLFAVILYNGVSA